MKRFIAKACSLLWVCLVTGLLPFPSEAQVAPASPCGLSANTLAGLISGEVENEGLPISSRFLFAAAGSGRAAVETELDLASWLEEGTREATSLCLAIVLEVDAELPTAHRQRVTLQELASAEVWRYTTEIQLPKATSLVMVIVKDETTGEWGATFAEETDEPLAAPGPAAVRINAATWHELVREAKTAKPSAPNPAATILRLVPPREQPASGSTRIDVLVSSDAVARVIFYLDGQQVAEQRHRPFGTRIELKSPPRSQVLRAVAYDAQNQVFGEDVLLLNQVDVPFRVKIQQLKGNPAAGAVEVQAVVTVPHDAALTGVEVFFNEKSVGRFTTPRIEARVPIPRVGPEDYIRVAATLADGSSIDDVVLLAAPGTGSEVEVNLVELHVVASDAEGRPIRDLKAQDFEIRVAGQKREVEGFAYADDVSLLVGLVIDSSGSMELLMHDTRKAAAKFLGTTVLPQDQAFVVDFDERPRLLQPISADIAELLRGLSRLEASGTTALYDAVVFSLLQFERAGGRKALVVLSDGDDRDSRFGPRQCIEYAQQWGVPIYLIALGGLDDLRRSFPEGELRRLTGETGGRLHFVHAMSDLDTAYAQIQEELRSQYTLRFYTRADLTADERRQVEVRVHRPGASARVVIGVRPASP